MIVYVDGAVPSKGTNVLDHLDLVFFHMVLLVHLLEVDITAVTMDAIMWKRRMIIPYNAIKCKKSNRIATVRLKGVGDTNNRGRATRRER